MTFHSDIISALETDVATAAVLASTQVYFGKSERSPHANEEVWIRQDAARDAAQGGPHQDIRERYTLNVRVRNRGNSDHSYVTAVNRADVLARRLYLRYRGTRQSGLISAEPEFMGSTAEMGTTDDDPLAEGYIRSTVNIELLNGNQPSGYFPI